MTSPSVAHPHIVRTPPGTEITPATGTVLSSILRLREACAQNGLSGRANTQLHVALKKTTWGSRAQQTFGLTRQGTLLASAERYDLHAVVNGRLVPMVGVGSVCGEDSSRGASAILALIESLTRDAATSLALLFPSAAVNGLVVDGFDPIPRTEITVRVIEDARRGAPMTTIRVGEVRDLQAIEAMGRTRAAQFRFALGRDADFIQYMLTRRRLLCGLGPAHTRQLQFFIAEEGITAAAYVVLSVTSDEWIIEECGDRDPTGARVGALLQALIAREPSRDRPTIRASFPRGFMPPQLEIVSSRPAAPVIRLAVRRQSTAAFYPDDVVYWPNDVL